MFLKENKIILSITLFIMSVLYLILSNTDVIFQGDSIVYLRMAYLFANGELPVSNQWMPLYSILIGTVNLFGLDFYVSVKVVNYFLMLCIVLVVFKIVNLVTQNKIAYILAGLILIFHKELWFNSIIIMAELPMLLLFILGIYRITSFYITNPNLSIKKTLTISFIICLGIFVKFNGLVLFALFFALIWYYKKQEKKVIHSLILIATVFIPYILWTKLMPTQGDMLINRFSLFNMGEMLVLNVKDFFTSIIDYYTNPKIHNRISGKIVDAVFNVSGFVVLALLAFLIIYKVIKKRLFYSDILILFVFLYSIMELYSLTSIGYREANVRTLFYPLFVSVIYFLIYIFDERNGYRNKIFASVVIGIFLIFNINSTYSFFKYHISEGYGILNTDYYKSTTGVYKNSIELIDRLKLQRESVYSNNKRLIGLHFNFQPVNKLPSDKIWLGNVTETLTDAEIVKNAELLIKQIIEKKEGFIVYFGSDNLSVFDKYYNFGNTQIRFVKEFYEDGFLMYYNQK